MNYLITGTAGFIGFHLARRLLEDGHRVIGFDAMTPYYDVRLKQRRHHILGQMPGFTPVIAQLEDAQALAEAARIARPEVIIHLAAQAGVRYSLENPKAYVESNLVGSWNVIELARQIEAKHLLMASTSSVYGANEKMPFAESDQTDHPMTLYAATKKSMEVIGHSYAHLYKLPTTCFRFFTVYGPWGRPDMALFKFVDATLKGQPIDVYGEGRMARDFTYIDDIVEGIVRLAGVIPSEANRVTTPGIDDTLSKAGPFRVVNIAGSQPTGLMSFIDTIERELAIPIQRNMLPMQKGDVRSTHAESGLLHALTGFRPGISVEAGVKAFVDWYRDYYGA